MKWSVAQRAGSSLVGAIATSPRLVLIIGLLLTVLASAATAYVVRRSVEKDLLAEMARQVERFRVQRVEREAEYRRALAPLVAERNRLKKRLAQYENAPKPPPPKSEAELVDRLKRLGF